MSLLAHRSGRSREYFTWPAAYPKFGMRINAEAPNNPVGNSRRLREKDDFAGRFLPLVLTFSVQNSWAGFLNSGAQVVKDYRDEIGRRELIISTALNQDGPNPVTGAAFSTLLEVSTGVFDAYFTKFFTDLIAGGLDDAIIRLGWEANGGWYAWCVAAGGVWANGRTQTQLNADYIAAWRHVHGLAMALAGANFRWHWCPVKWSVALPNAVNALELIYPGAAYVDYVGLDLYNAAYDGSTGVTRFNTNVWGPARGTNTGNSALRWLMQFSAFTTKPIILGEVGTGWWKSNFSGNPGTDAGMVGGADDPVFLQQLVPILNNPTAYVASSSVYGWIYWDRTANEMWSRVSKTAEWIGRPNVASGGNSDQVESALKDHKPLLYQAMIDLDLIESKVAA